VKQLLFVNAIALFDGGQFRDYTNPFQKINRGKREIVSIIRRHRKSAEF
jgi:hypothetical protein